MKQRLYSACALLAIAAIGVASMSGQQLTSYDDATSTTTTVTNATGTISQLNYGADGSVQGFLLGTNTLLFFPSNICAGIASLGAAGNSVTYSGTSFTNSGGFTIVEVSSFTNTSTKATFSTSASKPKPAAYGPTSGTVKQLNYDASGDVDAFVFMPSGATTPLLVETGIVKSTALKTALVVGATVSVTGQTQPGLASMCAPAGALSVVEADSLTIGGTNYVITGTNNGIGFGFGGFGPGRGRH